MRLARLTRSDDGKRLSLAVGDKAVVALEENPTTGYRWTAEVSEPARLVLEKSEFRPGSGDIGGGGVRVFHSRAAAEGEVALTLELSRSWETGKPPLDRCAFFFSVGPGVRRAPASPGEAGSPGKTERGKAGGVVQ